MPLFPMIKNGVVTQTPVSRQQQLWKSRPAPAELPAWVTGAIYAEIRLHHLLPSILGIDPNQTTDLRAQLEDTLVR
jgi:hypothetical protein